MEDNKFLHETHVFVFFFERGREIVDEGEGRKVARVFANRGQVLVVDLEGLRWICGVTWAMVCEWPFFVLPVTSFIAINKNNIIKYYIII